MTDERHCLHFIFWKGGSIVLSAKVKDTSCECFILLNDLFANIIKFDVMIEIFINISKLKKTFVNHNV